MLTDVSGENLCRLIRETLAGTDVTSSRPVAVAVSGGADSMALLWAVAEAVPAVAIRALTVDHGLRAEAADEAAMVSDWCRTKGIDHHILKWTGDKPSSGVQAAARAARYRLLCQACEEAGASVLMTAHHADDQAETLFARLARGSGVEGLAAMPAHRLIAAGAGEPVDLRRPFLSCRRDGLRALAKAQGVPFSDDPSNDDPAYERVRRRAFLAAAGVQNFLDVEALWRTANAAGRAALGLERQLESDFKAAGGWFGGAGTVTFSCPMLAALPSEAQARLIARAMEAVGGGVTPVLVDAAPDWRHIKPGGAATAAGALVQPDGETLIVMREPAALNGRADGSEKPVEIALSDCPPGEPVLWDRRFIVTPAPSHWQDKDISIAPLGLSDAGPVTRSRLASTMPGLQKSGRFLAGPAYAKTMLWQPHAPWNRDMGSLHVRALTEERFFRRVIRF